MNKKKRKLVSVLLAAVMLLSLFSGTLPGQGVLASAAEETGTQITAGTAATTPVVAANSLGNVVLEQTKVNTTHLTVKVEDVNAILANKSADEIKVTAKMYYGETVVQNVEKKVSLNHDVKEYDMDFENFGKFSVNVEYVKEGKTVSASEAVTVGIVATAYNLAPINASFPVTVFSLSLWDDTSFCITKDASGNTIPTIAMFERVGAWDWNNLPENVYKLPTIPASAYEQDFINIASELNAMAAYVKDLYEISPNAFFHLYSTDNFVENTLRLFEANQIPESQYHTTYLSDGSGSYSIFNETFKDDKDGSLYEDMRKDWAELKQKTRENGYYDVTWAKHFVTVYGYYKCIQNYAAVAAADENIDWWVARTNGTFNIENQELLEKVKADCTVKGVSAMLKEVQSVGKESEFKKLYHFDNDMFSEARKDGKPIMLILGSIVSSEPDFNAYVEMVMKYYGDSYAYYYKGHPGTPTILHPSKQEQLKELGIVDVDSSIPAELILFFFPDIYMCGYDSSTFQSVESDKMACGMFNMTKADGLQKTYGNLLDFFTSPVSNKDAVYGELCKEEGHPYFLLEFNDTSDFDIAIYDAAVKSFTYYKKTSESGFTPVKATPVIQKLPTAGTITEGKSLADAKLSGGQADVEGTFAWKNPDTKPTKADSGKTKFAIVFTPKDSEQYNTVEAEITVQVKAGAAATSLKQGQKITVDNLKYAAVVSGNDVSLKFVGSTDKKCKQAVIPAKVTYKGKSYKVTEISANAFAKNTDITKITIGNNVVKIGNKAFTNCKNLKTVIIKSSKITSFGANAFKGIHKKAKFTLPKAKKSDYKRKIAKAGFILK